MEANVVASRITSVQSCQVCLFSATYSEKVREFAMRIVPSPKITVEIPPDRLSLDKLAQYFIDCQNEKNKFVVLHNLFSSVTVGQSIIFVHVCISLGLYLMLMSFVDKREGQNPVQVYER